MAFIIGRESQLISEASEEDILVWVGASSYLPRFREKLIDNIRKADRELLSAKGSYGHGVSVKVIVVNISEYHTLRMERKESQIGKNWSDNKVTAPTDIEPGGATAIFHGKQEWIPNGTRAGMTYSSIGSDGRVDAKISLAWDNPFKNSFDPNHLAVAARISKDQDKLDEALRWCEDNEGESIMGSLDKNDGSGNERFVHCSIKSQCETTSYILYIVTVDDGIGKLLPTGN